MILEIIKRIYANRNQQLPVVFTKVSCRFKIPLLGLRQFQAAESL